MQATMTRREEHANNLLNIRDLSRDNYYRKMSFKEAEEWLQAYEHYTGEGYPREIAVQYCWDFYFAGRRAK